MTKKAAVISDLSSFGRCSLAVFLPILAVMGIQACPFPTAVLSAQSEFPVFFKKDLTDIMPGFRAAWAANNESFDGICTGYFSSGRQIDEALAVIHAFKKEESVIVGDSLTSDILGGKNFGIKRAFIAVLTAAAVSGISSSGKKRRGPPWRAPTAYSPQW